MLPWLVRMVRGWRLDRNPLRRRSDRAETVIGIWLLVACAAAVPFTARGAAAGARALAEHARVTALATRHEVAATTLAPPAPASAATDALTSPAWARATWTAPDGRRRTGQIQVPAGTRAGTPERIWVTGHGDPAAPALPLPVIARLGGRAAFAAVLALILLFLAAAAAVRRVISRQRLAAWDADWAVTGPRWTHQC
jgi:hypothetical protein